MTYLGETLSGEGGWERRTVWYGGLFGSLGQLSGLGAGAQHYSRTPAEQSAIEKASRNNAEAILLSMRGTENAYRPPPRSGPSIDEVASFLRAEAKRLGGDASDYFVVWAAALVLVALAVVSLRGHW